MHKHSAPPPVLPLLSFFGLLPALLLTGVSGCADGDPPSSPRATAELLDPALVNQTLCTSAPSGDGPAATSLRALQGRVQADKPTADLLIALGRGWVRMARQTADPGLYLHAAACTDLALELAPQSAPAQNVKLLVLLNDHRFTEARDLARKMVAHDPQDQMAWGSLSDAALELGAHTEAIAAAQKMVDLKPNLPSYARASYIAWLHGDGEAARLIARQAVSAGQEQKMREPLAWVLVQTSMFFWHAGDIRGAAAGFDLALDKHADYPPALVGKSRVALAQGRAADAQRLLEKAYAASPLVETAWLLGDAALAAGDGPRAERAYADVVRTGRLHDKRTLALFLATRNERPHAALQYAEAELKTRPGLYTKDAYVLAMARTGRAKEALPVVEELLSLGTSDPRVIAHAGFVKHAAGDVIEGRALMMRALEQSPHFDTTFALEVRRVLAL